MAILDEELLRRDVARDQALRTENPGLWQGVKKLQRLADINNAKSAKRATRS